ncbi:1475_t:CDS:2 [Paraglomus occultum]|uniref:1475_t:CDS:1 n=1 Tax=Paraglomus occultum TaxID=144539 RepID=A0A9N9GBY8_9GLOM|nr:1475_t:CDS:2 [Paraglomus occultum]
MEQLEQIKEESKYLPSTNPLVTLVAYWAEQGNIVETEKLVSEWLPLVNQMRDSKESGEPLRTKLVFSLILMKAHLGALKAEVESIEGVNERLGVPSHRSRTSDMSAFFESWTRLVESFSVNDLQLPWASRQYHNAIVQFQIFANRLSEEEFPLSKAYEKILNMRSEGIQVTQRTFLYFLEAQARTATTGSTTEKPDLSKAAEIYYLMEKYGYNTDKSKAFKSMLEASFPSSEHQSKAPEDRSKILHSIFDVERMMGLNDVPHNVETMRTLLKHVFEAAAQKENEALYALNVVRYQMLREFPPVKPTFRTYRAMLKCASVCKDLGFIQDIVSEIEGHIADSVHDDENIKWNLAIIDTYLHTPGLINDGKTLAARLRLESRVNLEYWQILIEYYGEVEHNMAMVKKVFGSFCEWRNKYAVYKYPSERKNVKKENAVQDNVEQPEHDGTKTSSHNVKGNRETDEDEAKFPQIIQPFPTPPLGVKDTIMINLYLKYSIQSGADDLAKDLFLSVLNCFPPGLAIDRFDLDVLKEFAYFAWQDKRHDDLIWFFHNVIHRVKARNDKREKAAYKEFKNWVFEYVEAFGVLVKAKEKLARKFEKEKEKREPAAPPGCDNAIIGQNLRKLVWNYQIDMEYN